MAVVAPLLVVAVVVVMVVVVVFVVVEEVVVVVVMVVVVVVVVVAVVDVVGAVVVVVTRAAAVAGVLRGLGSLYVCCGGLVDANQSMARSVARLHCAASKLITTFAVSEPSQRVVHGRVDGTLF